MNIVDQIRRIISIITVYALGIFYSITVIFSAIVDWFKHCLQYWTFNSTRTVAPSLLKTNNSFVHGYIKLQQSNIRLHYVEAGDRSKPLMLCLHGFPEFWYSWRYQIEEFSADYWVVAIDMRGYGDSDKPTGVSNYEMNQLVEDIRQVPQALGRSRIDILLAHDWGAAIGWAFTAKFSDLVGCYIPMNCPHPTAFYNTIRGNMKQFRKSWYMFFFQIPWLPEWFMAVNDFYTLDKFFTSPKTGKLVMSKDDLEAFKYSFSKQGDLTAPINYYRANFDPAKGRGALPRVTSPTCLIFGTEDLAIETSAAVDSQQFCDNFELHKIEGISHWVQQEAPSKVNEIIKEFLAKVPRTA